MNDLLNKLWAEIKTQDMYKAIAIIVCIVLIFVLSACQITTKSIDDPNQRVSVAELQAEIDTFYANQEAEVKAFEAKANAAAADVNSQIAFRSFVYESALDVATSGGFNWLNLLTAAGSIVGAGAVADNVRLRVSNKSDTKKTV
jgi:hypothetical protein